MKTKWLLVLIFYSTLGFAQEYDPLLVNTKIWTDLNISSCGPVGNSCRLKTGDVVVIGNESYFELLKCTDSLDAEWIVTGYARETNDSLVFYKSNFNIAETQIFDFSMQIGDTASFLLANEWTTYIVDSVYYKIFAGRNRKHIHIVQFSKDSVEYPQDLWIEGIGSVYGLLSTPYLGSVGVIRYLLCFEQDGQLLYHFDQLPYGLEVSGCFFNDINDNPELGKSNLFPNPAIQGLPVELTGIYVYPCEIEIYNMLGMVCKKICLQGPESKINIIGLKQGMYFLRFASQKKLPEIKLIVQ